MDRERFLENGRERIKKLGESTNWNQRFEIKVLNQRIQSHFVRMKMPVNIYPFVEVKTTSVVVNVSLYFIL